MPRTLVVVRDPREWPLDEPDIEVASSRSYLSDKRYSRMRNVRVINLSRNYRYQSSGYYVSLLAEARGHKPMPGVATMLDLRSTTIVRFVSEDLDADIQRSLAPIQGPRFALSVYFGRNFAKRHERLSQALFKLFPAPLLKAQFLRRPEGWQMVSVAPIPLSELDDEHRRFALEAAREYLASRQRRRQRPRPGRYDLAILLNPDEPHAPSDQRAIDRFVRAAESLDMEVELITRGDYGRLAEFDALFIRETTAVNHHTFRFAQRAAAQGLVVIDDPDSILRCTNKVYLAELLEHHRIATPRTLVVHRDNREQVADELGLPLILKQPDSAFSQGVFKVTSGAELQPALDRLFADSDLVIAQAWTPTDYDWRVGVLDGRPLYACKYFMAGQHWQIIRRDDGGDWDEGMTETYPVESAPLPVVDLAVRAASLIGTGFYGVDIKESNGRPMVIEVNDNPSIEAGIEDAVLKQELYLRVMRTFIERIERRRQGVPR